MDALTALSAAIIITAALTYGLYRGVDVFSVMARGVGEGLRVVASIFPALVCLLTAVRMLSASGFPEALTAFISPVLEFFGIPEETALLLLLRPLSGSAAMAAGSEIITAAGADSLAGRTAAVMLGSTETTFYVAAVYFAAAGVKKTRWAIPAALVADAAGFLLAAWSTRLFWG